MIIDNFEFDIQGISVINFSYNLKKELFEKIKENPKFNEYTMEINSNIRGYIDVNVVNIEIQVLVFLEKEKQTELARIIVDNNYVAKELNRYYDKTNNKLDLPNNISEMLISFSVCHARAILLEKCAGTFLVSALIPMVNPTQFVPPKKSKSK